jgi:GGDEF domain-containing protein
VAEAIAEAAQDSSRGRSFAYFDFDDFKPFNDRYGFRQGDRVIQLFADILRSTFARKDDFVGHLGGDDFFATYRAASGEEALAAAAAAADRFKREATSFYSPEDRERGWIVGRDRSGAERRMRLIGASIAVAFVEAGASIEEEDLSEILAELKKQAKASASRSAFLRIGAASPSTR